MGVGHAIGVTKVLGLGRSNHDDKNNISNSSFIFRPQPMPGRKFRNMKRMLAGGCSPG